MLVLINPPVTYSKTEVGGTITPPLGIAYLAAYAREKGIPVKVIDAVGEKPEQITQWKNYSLRGMTFEEILAEIPKETKLVGVSNLFTFSFPIVEGLLKKVKKQGIKTVVGGAHPSAVPEEVLKSSSIDYVIISEGEESLVALYDYVIGRRRTLNIDGIGYKVKGKIKINPKKHFIKDLDSLPYPARDLLPMKNYWKTREAHGPTKDRWTPILSSRGCPYNCTFCTSPLWNFCWRARSPENVVNEIEYCVRKMGIREFHFEDENMTLDKKRLLDICKEIIRRDLNITWQTPNGIRASVTDEEMLEAMNKSGCTHITVAPESGSERVLNEIINKKQNLESVERVVTTANKLGMRTAAFFILGLPGETKDDLEKTVEFGKKLAKLGLDEVDFGLFVPLPGSELYKHLEKEDLEKLKEANYMEDLSKAISWSKYVTDEELKNYRRRAYLSFYLTQLWYHPGKVSKTLLNIVFRKQETKTQRSVQTLLKRIIK